MFKDTKLNRDMHERITWKFYAVVRFKLYQSIKSYWDGVTKGKDLNPNNDEEVEALISEEIIISLAQQID